MLNFLDSAGSFFSVSAFSWGLRLNTADLHVFCWCQMGMPTADEMDMQESPVAAPPVSSAAAAPKGTKLVLTVESAESSEVVARRCGFGGFVAPFSWMCAPVTVRLTKF